MVKATRNKGPTARGTAGADSFSHLIKCLMATATARAGAGTKQHDVPARALGSTPKSAWPDDVYQRRRCKLQRSDEYQLKRLDLQ